MFEGVIPAVMCSVSAEGMPHLCFLSQVEYVDEGRHAAYFERLAQESRQDDAPGAGYIDGDTPLFERIASVEGVFNRLVVYRRNSLHCGRIDNGRALPTDPLQGRLSINAFIDPAG